MRVVFSGARKNVSEPALGRPVVAGIKQLYDSRRFSRSPPTCPTCNGESNFRPTSNIIRRRLAPYCTESAESMVDSGISRSLAGDLFLLGEDQFIAMPNSITYFQD